MKKAAKKALVFIVCCLLVISNTASLFAQIAESAGGEAAETNIRAEFLSDACEFAPGDQIKIKVEYTNAGDEALTDWNILPEVVKDEDSEDPLDGFEFTEENRLKLFMEEKSIEEGILKESLPALPAGETYEGEYTLVIDESVKSIEDIIVRITVANGEKDEEGIWQWNEPVDRSALNFSVVSSETSSDQTETKSEPAEQEKNKTFKAPVLRGSSGRPLLGAGNTHNVTFYGFDDVEQLHIDQVADGATASPYTILDGDIPTGLRWDGKWYTDVDRTQEYNFSTAVTSNVSLFPGKIPTSRVIFITYGERIAPVTVDTGKTINLNNYTPTKTGYVFDGWYADEELTQAVSGQQTISGNTTFYAKWTPGYISFDPIRWLEEKDTENFDIEAKIGTWYAKVGSTIYVDSTYAANGTGTHAVKWELDGETGNVLSDPNDPNSKVYLEDVYSGNTKFVFNNAGQSEWDKYYAGSLGVPYNQQTVIAGTGNTKVNFYYMSVRSDVVLTFDCVEHNRPGQTSSDFMVGSYLNMYDIVNSGKLDSSINSGARSGNYDASGVTADGIEWTYVVSGDVAKLTLKDLKYSTTRIRQFSDLWHQATFIPTVGNMKVDGWTVTPPGEDPIKQIILTSVNDAIAHGNGRSYASNAEIPINYDIKKSSSALHINAYETLPGETPDFTAENGAKKFTAYYPGAYIGTGGSTFVGQDSATYINGKHAVRDSIGSREDPWGVTVNSTTGALSFRFNKPVFYMDDASVSDLSIPEAIMYEALDYMNADLADEGITQLYIFTYERHRYNLTFDLEYDADGDSDNEKYTYEDIMYSTNLGLDGTGYPNYDARVMAETDGNFGKLITERPGYEFVGWSKAVGGAIMTEDDWNSFTMPARNQVVFANWVKKDFRVEFYEDRESDSPFESRWMGDGELVTLPDTSSFDPEDVPEKWVWQSDEVTNGIFEEFNYAVPMYGEYGVQETDPATGKPVWVIKIYGTKKGLFDLNIDKSDSVTGAALQGVGFTLYKKTGSSYVQVGNEIFTSAQGKTSFMDLEPNVRYKFSESTVPDGYQAVEDIYFYANSDGEIKFCDEDGNAENAPSWIEANFDSNKRQLKMDIVNVKLYELPSTGGIGIYLFTVLGAMLMTLAVLTVTRKRTERL